MGIAQVVLELGITLITRQLALEQLHGLVRSSARSKTPSTRLRAGPCRRRGRAFLFLSFRLFFFLVISSPISLL
jgi:hypothetical protein